jgi:hypothetical protein
MKEKTKIQHETTIKTIQLEEIPKKYSSRNGCFWCKAELKSMKEKVLRTCKNCATETRQGFDKMSKGQVREGFQDIQKIIYGENNKAKQTGEYLIKNALTKRRKKIEKKLRRKGLDEKQITEGLKQFDKIIK